jgi:putative ABC transport system ATP-binding protein
MLGCVDAPSSGTLLFDGREVSTLGDRARSLLRLRQIGFVFQRFFLLPMLTAPRTSSCPGGSGHVQERASRAHARAARIRRSRRAGGSPAVAAFGREMQRVAIARALANRPRLLLADEPTGELDQSTGEQIASLLDRVNADGTRSSSSPTIPASRPLQAEADDEGRANRERGVAMMDAWR